MRWLRLYSEARTDRKLAILSLAERGVWVNLLCFANEHEERGTFDASDRYLLAIECADGDEALLNATLDKLLRVKHLIDLDGGRLAFRTFNARQYDKPSDAPEATRERKRKQRQHASSPDSNAMSRDVTPTSRDVSPLYIDSESEREESITEERDNLDEEGANAPVVGAVSHALCGQIAKAAHLTASVDSLQRLVTRHIRHFTPDELITEADKAAEWIAEHPKRQMNLRFLDNWLKRAATPLPQSQQQQNGAAHHGTTSHHSTGNADSNPDPDGWEARSRKRLAALVAAGAGAANNAALSASAPASQKSSAS